MARGMGLKESRRLESRRRRWTFVKAILGLSAVGTIFGFAYITGAELAKQEVNTLTNEIAVLTRTVDDLKKESVRLETARQEADARELEAKERYNRDVPTGRSRELFMLLSERLQDGVDPSRLEFVISAVNNGDKCANQPRTKRFILRTPIYSGRNDWVGFANTTVVVTGLGEASQSAEGRPVTWFDPAKPVKLSFKHIDGEVSEANGMLPLQHSVVRGDTEFRFTITEGESRGFVYVTFDRCKFP